MSKAVPSKRESIDPGSEEDLDPRIQVELEKLNSATDEINKLEKELDEANGQFRHLLSQQGGELEKLIRKLGPSIDRARPFYDAKGAADELHKKCLEAAAQFHRATANGQFRHLLSQQGGELEKLIRKLGPSIDRARPFYDAKGAADGLHKKCLEAAAQFHRATDVHRAARETVTAVETRYEKDVNFDSTWQEVLNHATIKVMDAEQQKSDSERCHRSLAEQFYEAEKKVYDLRKVLERDILKSKPYFDMKNRLNAALSEVKTRTVKLQSGITAAKRAYSLALSNLEMISEEIHRKRTPGVGAENEQNDRNNEQPDQQQQMYNNNSSGVGKKGVTRDEQKEDQQHGDQANAKDEDDEEDEQRESIEQSRSGGDAGDRRGDGASSSSSGQLSSAD